MKIHLIAIGGAVMHNVALALHEAGHEVTGSDDEIYEPAASRLRAKGLLPAGTGWDSARLHSGLDGVILGMHAKADNPELLRARELNLRVWSFPEFMYEHSRNKQRIVIAGSHGKTTITSMVMHVLRGLGRDFDYLVGAQLPGFDTMVRLSESAPVIVLEGDEYLSSPIDRRPKFLLYQPHIALISGVAWDHINVFPTEADYVRQFELLIHSIPKAGTLIYNEKDKPLRRLVNQFSRPDEQYIEGYSLPDYKVKDGKIELRLEGERGPVGVIGRHNLSNISAAWAVCRQLAVDAADFVKQIASFKGAAKRLEKLHDDGQLVLYKDFAHAPSKVAATVDAVTEFYPRWNVVACLELHTFSSLNKEFLPQYRRTMRRAHKRIVFIDRHSLEKKQYPPVSKKELISFFDDSSLEFAESAEELQALLQKLKQGRTVMLMMSSGNWAGMDLLSLVK